MKDFNYNTAPSDEVFEDLKQNAIKIWKTYDDTYGYQSEKIGRIENLANIRDNYWTMIGMFDPINQIKLIGLVKPETAELIKNAISGGIDVI